MWPFKPKPTGPVDWELIDKTILPSAKEQGMHMKQGDAGMIALVARKTIVFTFKDRLSGRVKQNSITSGCTGTYEL